VRGLDDVVAELARLSTVLDQATDLGQRVAVRDRLNELRAEAASLRGPHAATLTDEMLRSEIARCERELSAVSSARFDPSMVAGASGFGGGLDPIQTARHNRAVDEAGHRAELEAELHQLVQERKRRSRS
jgi:hypothetical protein